MRFDWVGQFGVIFVSSDRIIYNLAISRILVELCGAFLEVACTPERGPHGLTLLHDLVLLKQLGKQNIERRHGHDRQNCKNRPGDHAALLHGFPETKRVLWCCRTSGQDFNQHFNIPLRIK